jgi:hypothetical protein
MRGRRAKRQEPVVRARRSAATDVTARRFEARCVARQAGPPALREPQAPAGPQAPAWQWQAPGVRQRRVPGVAVVRPAAAVQRALPSLQAVEPRRRP